jgi:Protein of unknown function (DUF2004)
MELEVEKRKSTAIAAIRDAFGTEDDEDGATLFVNHHLQEVEGEYWEKHLGTRNPEPRRVLDILVFQSHWGGDDDLETFDFTLPDEVTDYLICVKFDPSGKVDEISMES